MKTFVVALAIDADCTPDWAAAEAAFAELDQSLFEPDAVELLSAATTPPHQEDVRSCTVGGTHLIVAAWTDLANHSWAVDAIGVLVGTGVLEAAGFELLISS